MQLHSILALEPRLLMAATIFDDVMPAALDQPRINAILRRGTGAPLSADFGAGSETINIQAFYDTGASGVLLSPETADYLGVVRATSGGNMVVFSDVGVAGTENFNVSEPLTIGLAPYHPDADVDNLATWQGVYNQSIANIRTQIGETPSQDPLLQNLDVFGIAAMQGKVVVMDPKTVNQFDDTMRTYVYNPGTPFSSANADSNPGIPSVNRHIDLSYGDFKRFTTVTPAGAPGPTIANNPFIGPNPVNKLLSNPPVDNTPGIVSKYGTKTVSGSWLFDTGAAASILSRSQASAIGITYKSGTFGTDNPQLNGVPLDEQFTLTIGGIGGTTKVAGFFLDSMSIPTMEGEPIVFQSAPVLVSDITVKDPVTSQTLTLDGIFGMNYLVASAYITEGGIGGLPDISNLTKNHFDWITFDQPNGILGLQVPGATTVSDTVKPTASATVSNITAAGGTSYQFTVTYSDNIAVKAASLDGNDLRVTGPNGFSVLAGLNSFTPTGNGPSIVATYKFTPPGGSWNSADNGTYTIALQGSQVTDTANNAANAVAALRTFGVNIVTAVTTGTITGVVFNDANANGAKDTSEKTAISAQVWVDYDNDGAVDSGEPAVFSNKTSGAFTLANVKTGTWSVRQIAPAGYRQTMPSGAISVSVTAGSTKSGYVFGDTTLGLISGAVFRDLNGNGVQNKGETGTTGWTVWLDKDKDGAIDNGETVGTDSVGGFKFNAIAPGTYVLRVLTRSGWTATTRTKFTITVSSGQVVKGVGFGQRQ